jgi:hypothetical protein
LLEAMADVVRATKTVKRDIATAADKKKWTALLIFII